MIKFFNFCGGDSNPLSHPIFPILNRLERAFRFTPSDNLCRLRPISSGNPWSPEASRVDLAITVLIPGPVHDQVVIEMACHFPDRSISAALRIFQLIANISG